MLLQSQQNHLGAAASKTTDFLMILLWSSRLHLRAVKCSEIFTGESIFLAKNINFRKKLKPIF